MHFQLKPHPESPPDDREMTIEVWLDRWPDGRAELSYHLHADTGRILLPSGPARGRADELWRTTCFELFLQDTRGYREYNFAPSGAWAAYAFDGYRSGLGALEPEHHPQIGADDLGDSLIVDVIIDLAGERRFGLSAVIEEVSGTKSYWALAHPPGRPDFHHDACFAATLPPIEQP
ncbi:MAG: hypothetical protein AVDCRST_MAG09-1246 [uncultured Sphingomonas sp.]|uniref:DOMON-like domain-containing protein n=1 Tax=uncultured Sphingomonas sp. TaxID=158754 RepID=A0A6J4SS50_9SPHN|nr:DOMON-like domain-containing protein [uncultured Sphingomonas sp.]CAA9503823.1 MAG: hypothetical protein AVDCRST_MAG09-1246 [uncultured Sphingomonas sp.]